MGRAVLFGHLALSPLVFSRATIEAFECNKVALLLVAAIVLGALAPRALAGGPGALAGDPLVLGVALFLASAVVSTLASISPWISLLGAHESNFGLTTLLGYAVLFLATRALCEGLDDARRLLLAPVVAAAGAAVYALVQVAGIDPILYARVAGHGGLVRPFATLGHPNFLAAYLAMALPLVATRSRARSATGAASRPALSPSWPWRRGRRWRSRSPAAPGWRWRPPRSSS